MSLGLSSAWSTSGGLAQYLAEQSVYELPDDYYVHYPRRVAATTLEAVHRAVEAFIANRPLTWLVIGDLTQIEATVRSLNLGEVKVLDADGNFIR